MMCFDQHRLAHAMRLFALCFKLEYMHRFYSYYHF